MDNSIWSVLDIIFVGAGIYVLYAWVMMKTKGEIITSILMSKDVELRKCKDLEGYKAYIAPRMLVFGIAAILYGAAGLVMALFLAVLIWYAIATRKGVQKFW